MVPETTRHLRRAYRWSRKIQGTSPPTTSPSFSPPSTGPRSSSHPQRPPWIAGQLEHILSLQAVQNDFLGLEYLANVPDIASVHDSTVIQRDLTRNLLKTLPDVLAEIDASFSERLADVDEVEWKEVQMLTILRASTNRAVAAVFVGRPLCWDNTYVRLVWLWTVALGLAGIPYRYLFPKPLQPGLGRLLALLLSPIKWLAIRSILPIVRERLDRLKDAKDAEGGKPRDLLQWVVDDAVQNGRSRSHPNNNPNPDPHLPRHPRPPTGANIPSLLSTLHAEASTTLPTLPSDPSAVRRRMPKLDSCIRETLRTHGLAAHTLQRTVVQREGVTTPDGVWLPQGSLVATFQADLFDEREGKTYDPLRYYNAAHAILETEQSGSQVKPKQKMAVDVNAGPSLAFGLGKHACPGRSFAEQNIKLILGYLLANYELEPLNEAPKFFMLRETEIPSEKMLIKVRRRRRREVELNARAGKRGGEHDKTA